MAMSQVTEILAHLQRGEKIHFYQALELYKCANLKGRIDDIKKLGYGVEKEMVEIPGRKKKFAEYFLPMPPGQLKIF